MAGRSSAASKTTVGRAALRRRCFDALARQLPADAVVTVDVGNHAYSLGRYLESNGQPVLMSGYLGSIGFGYPAAMGAWAAAPGRPIIAVTGDGGFAQYAAELTTAVKYGIPIKHLLLDNHALGKIGKEQLAGHFPVWHTSLHNPDWAAYTTLSRCHRDPGGAARRARGRLRGLAVRGWTRAALHRAGRGAVVSLTWPDILSERSIAPGDRSGLRWLRGPMGRCEMDSPQPGRIAPRPAGRATGLPDDTTLLAGLRAGDEEIFSRLVDAWAPTMLKLARG